MKKTGVLKQGQNLFADMASALILLTGMAAILTGCETAHTRASLAPPPPAFDPAAIEIAMNEEQQAALIEPAAGQFIQLPERVTARGDHNCLQMGVDGGDALGYQWGDGRLGVGFAPSVRHEDKDSFGTALVRYSFSLHKESSASPCARRSFW